MILDPDFLNHWKTRALSAALGQGEALTAVLALWAHCQTRKAWRFPMNSRMLTGICQYAGDHQKLATELVACGFLDEAEDGQWEVHGWAEKNGQLVHNWEAGKTGGRPRKNPRVNPADNPRVNPAETLGEPKGEPIRLDKIREEIPPTPEPGELFGEGVRKSGDSKTETITGECQQRIGAMMRRRTGTKWSAKELRALRAQQPIPPDDLAAVEARYTAHWPPSGTNFLRHDILTLLNNWPGEVDRARHSGPRSPSANTGRRPASVEPKSWRGEWQRLRPGDLVPASWGHIVANGFDGWLLEKSEILRTECAAMEGRAA